MLDLMIMKGNKFILYLYVIASIPLFWGNPISTVLCFGEDGHIAIEASQNFICYKNRLHASEINSGISTHITSLSSSDHCGPCVDVPFFFSSLGKYTIVSREFSSLTQPEPLNYFFHTPEKLASRIVHDIFSIITIHPINLPLVSLQNTILLI